MSWSSLTTMSDVPRRVLLVAATEGEIAALRPNLEAHVDVLVTGVGMVATASRCSRALALTPYGLALNVGICGTFDRTIALGTVVHVVRDQIAELGAEDADSFVTIEEMQLPAEWTFVNSAPPAIDALRALPAVNAITVNKVHGNEQSIAAVLDRFRPEVESMEGAAFMSACLLSGVPFAQVRAVSNVVERRNRGAWRLAQAIDNLTEATRRILAQA
jgi:futalosine hydrolase